MVDTNNKKLNMGNTVSSESLAWSRVYEEIKNTHDYAYKLIDEAISLEEHEKPRDVSNKIFINLVKW